MSEARAGPEVRDYRAGDREACLAVFDTNVPKFFSRDERPRFASFLDHLPGPYLVLTREAGEIVACGGAALEPGGRVASLCWGMVSAELHGTGLGKLLLQKRIERVRRIPGVELLRLDTSQHTRGFYERFGFVTREIVENGYAARLDRCELTLDLRAGE
jgi:ribosomal protein S18 acetylase RimI-like enzyme